eukprot:scaffold278_cov20-Tisochrysis_lutea.AAC.3
MSRGHTTHTCIHTQTHNIVANGSGMQTVQQDGQKHAHLLLELTCCVAPGAFALWCGRLALGSREKGSHQEISSKTRQLRCVQAFETRTSTNLTRSESSGMLLHRASLGSLILC